MYQQQQDTREIIDYYESTRSEQTRLQHGRGQLEMARMRQILRKYLPPAPACVLDIGGGAGIHAFWLADQGYKVTLIDNVPLHIRQAQQQQEEQSTSSHNRLHAISLCDARDLSRLPNQSFDAIILFGPLYHLDKKDRHIVLRQVYQKLTRHSILIGNVLSRFASTLGGLFLGHLDTVSGPYNELCERDIKSGKRNPRSLSLQSLNIRKRWTHVYFHRPEEIREELEQTSFIVHNVVGLEGPCWLLPQSQYERIPMSELTRIASNFELECITWSANYIFIAIKNEIAKL